MASSPLLEPQLLRRLEALAVIVRRAAKGQMGGERRSVNRGRSPEFADFRNYTPGDDYRLIDWNAYARLDRFMLRLFVAEEELPFNLFVDLSGSMDWGSPNKAVTARRLAGAIAYVALASGVGALLPTLRVRPVIALVLLGWAGLLGINVLGDWREISELQRTGGAGLTPSPGGEPGHPARSGTYSGSPSPVKLKPERRSPGVRAVPARGVSGRATGLLFFHLFLSGHFS